jgi:DNA-binding HxlR family transcriptional regulator
MLGRDYPAENCSIARALEVVGERWSLLILRDSLFRGMSQYSEFEESLGLASNVLANRLTRFVTEGLFVQDGNRYRPTQKARDLAPALLALTQWGDTWAAPDGAPVIYHATDMDTLRVEIVDESGRPTDPRLVQISARPGPGSRSR